MMLRSCYFSAEERTWSAAELLDLGAEEQAVRSVSLT